MSGRAIVISDIHMGPGGALTTFREEDALAGFLDVLARDDGPIELILAGDVFDFLQAPGYDGFDASRAVAHFESILGNGATHTVIQALKRFARPGQHEVTLLSGNHDPELLLPDVRALFEDRIGRRGSVRHADDEPLVRARQDSPAVYGRALGPAGARVWVVHGDRWDPTNAINRAAVCAAAAGGTRASLPTGSHLVFEVLSQVKPGNPWIDELKPEFPAVLLLMLYLDPARTAEFLRKHQALSGGLLRDQVSAILRAGPLFEREREHDARPLTAMDEFAALLADALSHEPEPRRAMLLARLAKGVDGDAGRVPLEEGTLADHKGLGRWLLRAWLERIRRTERFQALDGPDDTPAVAAPFLDKEVIALVAGHTHGARNKPIPVPSYFNTGTWLPVGSIPGGSIDALIDDLEQGRRWPAEAPRTFVEIILGDGEPIVKLGRCDSRGAATMVR